MTVITRLIVAFVALSCAACGDNPTSPSDTSSTTATTSTSGFELTVAPRSDGFYSFTTSSDGPVTITLASVTIGRSASAVPVAMRIGLGVPVGEGCSVTTAIDVTPSLTAQLGLATVTAGTYCIDVADIGNLSTDAVVAVRFTHS